MATATGNPEIKALLSLFGLIAIIIYAIIQRIGRNRWRNNKRHTEIPKSQYRGGGGRHGF